MKFDQTADYEASIAFANEGPSFSPISMADFDAAWNKLLDPIPFEMWPLCEKRCSVNGDVGTISVVYRAPVKV